MSLEGVRIIDLTSNVAGPFASLILADLGAEVINFERPGSGDETRQWGPPFWGGESAAFLALNRNKRNLALDLKNGHARPVLERLLAAGDVLLSNLRPAEHPQVNALDALPEVPNSRIDGLRAIALPIRNRGAAPPIRRPPPARGESSAAVLAELGYSRGEVSELAARGAAELNPMKVTAS